jgi:general secretion pathway protein H
MPMSATDGRWHAQGGFTLLELLVVLAIAGLDLTLEIPNVGRHVGRPELAAAARELASELRLARSRAISENRPAVVVADVEAAAFGSPERGTVRRLPHGIGLAIATTTDQMAGGSGSIRFYPDGTSSGGGVALTHDGLRYEVLVNWLNGGVSVHDRSDARKN